MRVMHRVHYLFQGQARVLVWQLAAIMWLGLNCPAFAASLLEPIEGTDRYFIKSGDSGHGVVLKSGEEVIEPCYRQIDYLGDGRFAARRYLADGKEERLLFDEHGKVLARLPYWADTTSRKYHGGVLLVQGPAFDQGAYINLKGKFINRDNYFRFGQEFSCGLAAVEYCNRGECYSAYINSHGKIAIGPFREAECQSFYKNRAIVRVSTKEGTKKTGVISTSGTFVIPPVYDCVRRLDEDFHPKIETKSPFARYSGDFILINYPAKFAAVNVPSIIRADTLIPCMIVPDSKSAFTGPLWGYCNLSGKMVIEPRFEYAREFSGGIAAVSVSDPLTRISRYGHIDTSGNWTDTPSAVPGNDKTFERNGNRRELFREILNSHNLIGMRQEEREAQFGKAEQTSPCTMVPNWAKNFVSYLIGSGCTGSTSLVFALDTDSRIIGWKIVSSEGNSSSWVRENVYAVDSDYFRPGCLLPRQDGDLIKQFGE